MRCAIPCDPDFVAKLVPRDTAATITDHRAITFAVSCGTPSWAIDGDTRMLTNRPGPGRLDLNLISALVVLIEERSTVVAARRLHLAQSTVSGILARLRDTFDDPLLVRNGRELEPTARALELVALARPHLDALVAAIGETTDFDPATDRRQFRLGCTDAAALATLPSLSRSLRREAPGCDLVVRTGDYRSLPRMLATGDIATALGFLPDDLPATARTRRLRDSPWVVLRDAARPSLAGIDDFCSRAHVLVSPLGDLDGFIDAELERSGRARRVVLGLSGFALLLACLPGSDLVATVPDLVATELARMGKLAIDPCPVETSALAYTLAWRFVTDRDPAERWFRERIAAAFVPAHG